MTLYKLFASITFALVISSINFAKAEIPDSLKTKIEAQEDLKEKINLSVNFMRSQVMADFDLATSIADYTIAWTMKSEDPRLIGKAYQEKAILHLIRREYAEARPFIKKAIEYYQKADDALSVGYAYRNLGVSYFYSSQLDSSVKAHFQALTHLDSTNQEHKLFYGLTCEELGKVFYESSNITSAKQYAQQAFELYKQVDDSLRIMDVYTLLVLTNNNLDTSIMYLDKIIEYSLEKGDSVRLYNCYANYGNKLIQAEDFSEGKKYSLLAFKWFEKYEAHQLLKVCVNLSNIYLKEEKLDSARYYLAIAIPKAEEGGENYVLENAYGNLAIVEEKSGNFELAYQYSLENHKYAIKNLGIERDRQIKAHELELELENKDRELEYSTLQNELLESRSNYQRVLLVGLIIGLLILLALLILLWNSQKKLEFKNQQLFENNRTIQQQKAELEQLLANNKNLFSIIGHDLRSPIANVFSALEIIPNEEDQLSDESKHIIGLMKNSLQSVSDLLENLLAWSKTQREDYNYTPRKIAVKDEFEDLLTLYRLYESTKNIKFNISGDNGLFIKTDPYAFRTILRNLISNSIKFSKDQASIYISWKTEAKNGIITIEDEAGGLPKEHINFINKGSNLTPIQSLSKGLGLRLTKSMVIATGAKLSYEKTTKGSRFTIEFKLA